MFCQNHGNWTNWTTEPKKLHFLTTPVANLLGSPRYRGSRLLCYTIIECIDHSKTFSSNRNGTIAVAKFTRGYLFLYPL